MVEKNYIKTKIEPQHTQTKMSGVMSDGLWANCLWEYLGLQENLKLLVLLILKLLVLLNFITIIIIFSF